MRKKKQHPIPISCCDKCSKDIIVQKEDGVGLYKCYNCKNETHSIFYLDSAIPRKEFYDRIKEAQENNIWYHSSKLEYLD